MLETWLIIAKYEADGEDHLLDFTAEEHSAHYLLNEHVFAHGKYADIRLEKRSELSEEKFQQLMRTNEQYNRNEKKGYSNEDNYPESASHRNK